MPPGFSYIFCRNVGNDRLHSARVAGSAHAPAAGLTLCRAARQEGISTIITAIVRSRMIFRRLETYIIYR